MSINIFMEHLVPRHLRHQYHLYDRTSKSGINNICNFPSKVCTVGVEGHCFLCQCDGWLPISVGQITDFKKLEDVWQNETAKIIQKDLLEKKFTYCSVDSCNIKKNNVILNRHFLGLNFDESCNLACPTCRKSKINITSGRRFDKKMQIAEHISKLISNFEQSLEIKLSGNGDPFASLIYRHLLSMLKLEGKRIEVELITNGILAKAHWHKISGIHKNLIRTKLSFDAGSETVYNVTRRGGDWNKLIDSTKFLVQWKQKNYSDMIITANFVVQTANYRDMPLYVDLCDKLGVDEINFQKIVDWGTFNNFAEHAVWQKTHSEHEFFLNILQSLNNKKINYTNLTDLKHDADAIS